MKYFLDRNGISAEWLEGKWTLIISFSQNKSFFNNNNLNATITAFLNFYSKENTAYVSICLFAKTHSCRDPLFQANRKTTPKKQYFVGSYENRLVVSTSQMCLITSMVHYRQSYHDEDYPGLKNMS